MADRVVTNEVTISSFNSGKESISAIVSALQSGDCEKLIGIHEEVQVALDSVADTLLILTDYAEISAGKEKGSCAIFGDGCMSSALRLLSGVTAVCSGALGAESYARLALNQAARTNQSEENGEGRR